MSNKYVVSDYRDSLEEGKYISFTHSLYVEENNEQYLNDVENILQLYTKDEIVRCYENAKQSEQEFYEQAKIFLKDWEGFAYKTQLFEKVIGYQSARKPKHTGNEWEIYDANHFYDNNSRSNMVYKFSIGIWGEEGNYYVKWGFYIRSFDVYNPYNSYWTHIDGQWRKHFAAREKAEQYIKGRIKKYDKYFQEDCPIVPKKYENNFKVNGMLLPWYKVEDDAEQGNNTEEITQKN